METGETIQETMGNKVASKLTFEQRQILRKLVSEKKKAIYLKDVKYRLN